MIFLGTAALFLLWTLSALWHIRWVRRLPSLNAENSPTWPGKEAVRCSIVLAARDEEARIEQTVRHLLEQRGIELEIIAVDDRSRDRTSEILRSLAKEEPRLRLLRVDVLPDGWLGKCHACHLGAALATGEWILFTDADCWLHPEAVARALRIARLEGVDHVTLTSGLAEGSLGLRAAHILFLLSIANWISGVNRDKPKSHLGIGAFNLVRTSVYRECGGYEALHLTVLDDIKLGLLVRRAGKRTRAFIGGSDAECHWGTSAWGVVKLMEKNYFAALDFGLEVVIVGCLFVALVWTILLLGLISGTVAGIVAVCSPMLLIVPAAVLARRLGWPLPPAICTPFMLPLFLITLLNSTYVTLRQGGVRWRDTFYPLRALKAHMVR